MPSHEVTPADSPKNAAYKPNGSNEPLWWRIVYEEQMVALVRVFGHRALPVEEAREKRKTLVERYGNEMMIPASDKIVEQDGKGKVQTRLHAAQTETFCRPAY